VSRTWWKQRERELARLLGASRHPANTGGLVDVEGQHVVAQVKERRTCSLAEIEMLAVEMERIGSQRKKLGIVGLKRSAGRGRKTPWLLVMTETVWRHLWDYRCGAGADPTC